MSNHHHHIPTPKVSMFKPELPKSAFGGLGNEEAVKAGSLIGKLLQWSILLLLVPTAFSGGTAFDLLRMKTAEKGAVAWWRLLAMWLGLVTCLVWATGLPGAVLGPFILAAFIFIPPLGFITLGLAASPLYVLNAFPLSLIAPTIDSRIALIKQTFNTPGRFDAWQGLTTPRVGSLSMLDLHSYVDRASLLIPIVVTVLATVKFFKLRKAQRGVGSETSVGEPWTPAQLGLLALGVVVAALGLPGAPAGFWVVASLAWWLWQGETKDTKASSSVAQRPVGSSDDFDMPPPAEPAPQSGNQDLNQF